MALTVTRQHNETWREAALRMAAKYGLETEVGEAFDDAKAAGKEDGEAALSAAIEWDVADYDDWSEP